jgi:hypothetical protein
MAAVLNLMAVILSGANGAPGQLAGWGGKDLRICPWLHRTFVCQFVI